MAFAGIASPRRRPVVEDGPPDRMSTWSGQTLDGIRRGLYVALMARYRAQMDVRPSPSQAFEYLSDFSHVREWEPGVLDAAPRQMDAAA